MSFLLGMLPKNIDEKIEQVICDKLDAVPVATPEQASFMIVRKNKVPYLLTTVIDSNTGNTVRVVEQSRVADFFKQLISKA